MSFHHSCENIHIREENGKTSLLCHARDLKGNLVPNRIHLDDHIGNSDGIPFVPLFFCKLVGHQYLTRGIKIGWFRWGCTNLTQNASNISLEHTDQGPKLTADLPMLNGGSRGRQGMFLGDKIENNNGHLKFRVSGVYYHA